MAINLSVKQLQHSDIVGDVRDALAESRLDAGDLTLEITESVMMNDTDLVIERLEELKALGVRLAMDDFGTGYSSLSYLSRLPVDILKMDRSFLRAGATPEASGLATAVVALGKTLQLDIVAEGIEYAEQWDTLRGPRMRPRAGLPLREADGRRHHARVPAHARVLRTGPRAQRDRCSIATRGSIVPAA